MYLNLAELSASQAYHTLSQTLIPRPIAWVLSDNGDGSLNLAPFSYFNALCSDPPLVMLSVGKKPDGTYKDTCVNIEQRNDFIIHIANTSQLDALNRSSATLPHGKSELDQLDIKLCDTSDSDLPRIEGCPIAYICRHYDIQKIGNTDQAMIIGEVMSVYIDDEVYDRTPEGKIRVDAKRVDPLLRLGAGEYGTLGEIHRVQRPG